MFDVASGELTTLVQLVDGPLAWSPDGARVMFHNPKLDGPEPAPGPAGVGAAPPAQLTPSDDSNLGLYVVDVSTHAIWRVRGGGGGHGNTLLGGVAPDWWAPSPTPTATPTATATPQPTATPTSLYAPRPVAYLPATFANAGVRGDSAPD